MVLLVVMSTYGGRTKPFPWLELVRKQQQDMQLDNLVKVREGRSSGCHAWQDIQLDDNTVKI